MSTKIPFTDPAAKPVEICIKRRQFVHPSTRRLLGFFVGDLPGSQRWVGALLMDQQMDIISEKHMNTPNICSWIEQSCFMSCFMSYIVHVLFLSKVRFRPGTTSKCLIPKHSIGFSHSVLQFNSIAPVFTRIVWSIFLLIVLINYWWSLYVHGLTSGWGFWSKGNPTCLPIVFLATADVYNSFPQWDEYWS